MEITTIYSVELEEDTFGEISGHQGAATRLRDGSTGLTLFTWKGDESIIKDIRGHMKENNIFGLRVMIFCGQTKFSIKSTFMREREKMLMVKKLRCRHTKQLKNIDQGDEAVEPDKVSYGLMKKVYRNISPVLLPFVASAVAIEQNDGD
ncbi:hypothetical protein Bca4012_095250 [Brassica carinata]|uniref:(rape) hypothetical protein n=1 Tax=Brassica napus TaxID=3708 RepID=A0A816US51_BRANA|nr:unnamed protein product [Brassica napus]